MRMAMSVRVDLPSTHAEFDEVVDLVTQAIECDAARGVLLVVFTEERPEDIGMPYAELVAAIEDELAAPVHDAILVTDGRAWSYRCDDPGCCPPEGLPLDPTTPGAVALSAAHALLGGAVLPDRASVVATVAPVNGIAEQSMKQAIERAYVCRAEIGDPAYVDMARATLTDVRRRYAEPPAALSHDEAAELVVAFQDIGFRDEVLVSGAQADEAVLRRVFGDLARLAIPPVDAPVCTLLACFAYLGGEGVITKAALDRALSTAPAYGLAQLVDSALRGQMHPKELRRALQQR
jgi:hypothetical protein